MEMAAFSGMSTRVCVFEGIVYVELVYVGIPVFITCDLIMNVCVTNKRHCCSDLWVV